MFRRFITPRVGGFGAMHRTAHVQAAGQGDPDLGREFVAAEILEQVVPWLFGEESTEVLRYFVTLKCRLMPYLFAAAAEASRTGVPVMRAMILEFPADPGCATLDRQYMLGPSLLVAPVFGDDGVVTYYLPPGRWTSLIDGSVVEGGRWRTETHGYRSLPLLARPGSIVALGADDSRPDYDYAQGVTFHVFEPVDGAEAAAALVSVEGRDETAISVRRAGAQLTIRATGSGKPWSACLRNVAHVQSVEGGTAEKVPEGIRLVPARGARTITVTI